MSVRHVDRWECGFCGILFPEIQAAYDHQREDHVALLAYRTERKQEGT